MDEVIRCRNHGEVVEGLRRCGRCGEVFCRDCLVEIYGGPRCLTCKNERLLDVLSGVDSNRPIGPRVEVYSPLAVAVYGLLLAFPSSLVLAVENWRAMGQQDRLKPHRWGFGLLVVILAVVAVRVPQAARVFAFAANLMAFGYFRQKLRADMAAFRASNPAADLVLKPWYRGLVPALLGVLGFMMIMYLVGAVVSISGLFSGR
jgi:hypothetical protein